MTKVTKKPPRDPLEPPPGLGQLREAAFYLNKPVFRITSLRALFVEGYITFAFGFLLGLIVAGMVFS